MREKCRIPKQKLDLDKIQFERMAFTRNNENIVRNIIFEMWQRYFAKRRARYLKQMQQLSEDSSAYRKLSRTKFVKFEQPDDLAGACKISAQVAYIVFPLAGKVVSNKRHTFVLLNNGEIYDMNRECRDVANLSRKRLQPYLVNLAYSNSREARLGRESWHDLIGQIIPHLERAAKLNKPDRNYTPKTIAKLPKWAKSIHLNKMKGGNAGNNDNDNDNNDNL